MSGNGGVTADRSSPAFFNREVLSQNLPTREVALSLLRRFQPTLRDEIGEIERGWNNKDLDTVRFHTHRIRSGSLYLGIEGIGLPATQLEVLLEQTASMDELWAAWSASRTACQYFLSQDQAELEAWISDFGVR